MFVNLSAQSREQLLGLVQTMRMSEADVVAFAIEQLFDQKKPHHSANGSEPVKGPKARRKLVREA
jgi:hypothetical protein